MARPTRSTAGCTHTGRLILGTAPGHSFFGTHDHAARMATAAHAGVTVGASGILAARCIRDSRAAAPACSGALTNERCRSPRPCHRARIIRSRGNYGAAGSISPESAAARRAGMCGWQMAWSPGPSANHADVGNIRAISSWSRRWLVVKVIDAAAVASLTITPGVRISANHRRACTGVGPALRETLPVRR